MSKTDKIKLVSNGLCKIISSTSFDLHTPSEIYLKSDNNEARYWTPRDSNDQQFIMFCCENPRTFEAISIQGNSDESYVTSFKLKYTLDNNNWYSYPKTIQGCTDGSTVITYNFDSLIRARCIAIHPVTWHNEIALRCELYCQPSLSTFTQVGHISSGVGGTLDSGVKGERSVVVNVKFPIPFSSIPKVAISFDYIDATANNQLRMSINATNITKDGFDAVFLTWWDSKVNRCDCDYIAICNE